MNRTERRRLTRQTVVPSGSSYKKPLLFICAFIVLLAIVGAGYSLWSRHQNETTTYTFTGKDLTDLDDSLMKAVDPNDPNNAYMPAFVRQNITWLLTQQKLGGLEIRPVALPMKSTDPGSTRMFSTHDTLTKKALLGINMLGIYKWIRVEDKMKSGFKLIHKNSFAIGLVHEAVHQQNPEFIKTWQLANVLDEEVRTYFIVDIYAVRPMLLAHQPVSVDLVNIDKIIKKCHDTPCSLLKDFLHANQQDTFIEGGN